MASTFGARRHENQTVARVRYLQKKIGTDLAMSKLAPPPKMGISLGKNFLR